jgi:ABC-2 type transport system permease protein
MRGYMALTAAEFRLFLRDPVSLIFVLVFPLMMMLLLSAVFGDDPADAREVENGMLVWRGVTPRDYYTAASIPIVVVALGVMTMPMRLAAYREQGVLRRMRASSVPAWTLFAGQFTVNLIAVAAGSLIMALAAWLLYGALMPEQLPGVVVAVLLGTVAFSAIGALLAALIPTSRAAQGIGLMLFFGMWLIAGTAPPRAVLPSGLRDFSDFLPLTRLVLAVQDPWYGFGWSFTDLAILAAIAIVTAAPAVWFFRWD